MFVSRMLIAITVKKKKKIDPEIRLRFRLQQFSLFPCTFDRCLEPKTLYCMNLVIWIRHSLQASIASTHRHVHVQIVVLGSFLHYS
jgi:hypothetical protein